MVSCNSYSFLSPPPLKAEACRSVAMAMKKCPNGMYAEIKYDGERVQLHKQGDHFEFFSRSLKPVQPHKVIKLKIRLITSLFASVLCQFVWFCQQLLMSLHFCPQVAHIKDFLPEACPHGDSMILDSEVS